MYAKGEERKQLDSILTGDLSNMEYKLTDLRNTGSLMADVYSKKVDGKYLMILDFRYGYSHKISASFVRHQSDELTKSHSELIELAKSRCAALGLPR